MIVFVCTRSHRYTHTQVAAALPAFRIVSYPRLLMRRRLPQATYIFADLDRLGFWQLEYAAHVCAVLRAAGCRVLNDPARFPPRLALLRRLFRAGLNSFDAWPASDADVVDRFPVFLRTVAAHRGALGGLLHDAAALHAAIAAAVAQGHPLAGLMIVEYRAEPMHGDVFRKLAVYRVGDAMVAAPSVHERNWVAKGGEDGVAGEPGYVDDLERIRSNPYGPIMRQAFEVACLDYGRSDFGLVGGRPELYEINTNPTMSAEAKSKLAIRNEAIRLSWQTYLAALRALNMPEMPTRIAIPQLPALRAQKRHLRLLPGYQWVP